MDMGNKYVSLGNRKHNRKSVNYKVNYKFGEESLSGEIVDVSIGGLLIKTTKTLSKGSVISFFSYIDGSKDGSPVMGKVVRSDNQHIGVKFINTSNHDKNSLGKIE